MLCGNLKGFNVVPYEKLLVFFLLSYRYIFSVTSKEKPHEALFCVELTFLRIRTIMALDP